MPEPIEKPKTEEPHRTKSNKFHFRLTDEDMAIFEARRQFYGSETSQATVEKMLHEKPSAMESLNPKCKTCLKHGGVMPDGRVLCITKKTVSDKVQIQEFSVLDASACAEKNFNIPLGKEDRQHYDIVMKQKDNAINLLTTQKNTAIGQHEKDHGKVQFYIGIEKELQGEKNKNKILEDQLENMPKIVLERDDLRKANHAFEEKNILLQRQVQDLSHDPLVEENRKTVGELEEAKQYIKIQDSRHTDQIEQVKGEREKLEALVKTLKDQRTDILSTVEKTLRDCEAFLPRVSSSCEGCLTGFNWKEYRQNALKDIQNLQGYLQTVAR
jgi:hypothetical protein